MVRGISKLVSLVEIKYRFIMKKTGFLLFILGLMLSYSACKNDVEDAIDCSVESILLSLNANVDSNTQRLVHFTFVNGDTIENTFTLDSSIRYEFGDGNETTLQSMEASHTYVNAGTFTAKAYYTLRKGSSSCDSYKEKTVIVD